MKRARVLAGLVLAIVTPATAQQEDSVLTAAVRLAQEGRGDSARAMLTRQMSTTATTDPLYPGLVYTMGQISPSAQAMTQYFRRVALEFAGSRWADDALLRLAQLDFAAGDMPGALRSIERLRSDYPASELRALADFWGARAWFEQNRPAEACGFLNEGLAMVGGNVEVRNQLEFYQARCQGVTPIAPGAVAVETPAPTGPVPIPTAPAPAAAAAEQPVTAAPPDSPTPIQNPDAAPAAFSVQVAAVGTRAAADKVAEDLRSAGLEPVVVLEGGLYKVRFGRFDDKDQARAAATQIRARVGGQPFVVPVP
jgi:cell division septation protein DedD